MDVRTNLDLNQLLRVLLMNPFELARKFLFGRFQLAF